MTTRFVAYVDDDYTGKEIPEGKADAVKIVVGGVLHVLDMDTTSPAYQSLQKFHAAGHPEGAEGTVRPIKSARSVTRATKATAEAKSTKKVTVTTVESRARVWAQDNGASGLPPRLPRTVIDAFNAKNPDLIPERFIKPVVAPPATVGKARKAAAAAFKEAKVS